MMQRFDLVVPGARGKWCRVRSPKLFKVPIYCNVGLVSNVEEGITIMTWRSIPKTVLRTLWE